MPASRDVSLPALPERYRPIRRLGQGGCAEVFLVEDGGGTPSPKAIKILLPQVARALVDAFRSEFRILASLQHPGLARVFDFGELPDGRSYYTAEYVEGEKLGGGTPGVRALCVATAAVCRTLAYLHARGYVHNDVKPANVLVGEVPESARLLDFGLAGLDRVRSRSVAGTPGYIAPERLEGQEWDGRADLYSVGATLYRVFAGRRVVDADRPTAAIALLRKGWRPLSEIKPDLAPSLATLVEQLLSLDPRRRPRHAAEVVARLGESIGEMLPLETPGTARCYALASVLFGRETELREAERLLREAGAGKGPRILAISGAPGMGKSRFLQEVVWRAETQGWRAAHVTCTERARPREPLTLLGAQIGAKLEGGPAENGGTGADGTDAEALLSGAGAGRTLFVLDDAHRAADAAWHTASTLARRAAERGAPVAIVLGFDREGLSSGARQWLGLGEASGSIAAVELLPIGPVTLRSMLTSLWGQGVIPPHTQESIATRSGGVPLLVEEIVGELVETGALTGGPTGWRAQEPTTDSGTRSIRLEDFLRRRTADLAPEAGATLLALAALGGRAPADAIATVAGPETDVALGTALLIDRRLAASSQGRVALCHESLAEIALGKTTPAERRRAHRAAAVWLAAHGASDAELARAYREAGDHAASFEHALAAGSHARLSGEGQLAVRWLEEARESAAAAATAGAPLAELERTLGEAYYMVGRYADATAALTRAFALLPPAAARERARIAALAVRPAACSADDELAASWLARAAEALPREDVLGQVLVDRVAGQAAWFRGRFREQRERFRAALAGLDRATDDPEAARLRPGLLMSVGLPEMRFDLRAADAIEREALAAAERAGDADVAAGVAVNLGDIELQRGAPAAASAVSQRGLEACERIGYLHLVPFLLANLAEAEHLLGRTAAENAAWSRYGALERAGAGAPRSLAAVAKRSRSMLAWRDDDLAGGARAAVEAIDAGQWETVVMLLAVAAAEAASRGDRIAADGYATRAETAARAADTPLDAVHAGLARGYAAAAEDPAKGGALLREAADGLAALGHLLDVPAVLRDAARFLARGGSEAAARECLARAVDILRAAGRRPELERIEELDRTLGGPPGGARPHGGGDDVARGAADRLTGLLSAPSLEELGRRLRTAAAVAGVRSPALAAVEAAAARPETSMVATSHETPSAMSVAAASRMLEISLGPVEVSGSFPDIVGRSASMSRALALLERMAQSDMPVLLLGETGTGKELFARALHNSSPRAAGPFVAVNCGAIPPALAESELFGHTPGAFTGSARTRHAGYFEQASGGTLLLDEIGELPEAVQPKLLRALDEGEVRPLGAERSIRADVRLVAATNRDLRREVSARRFRKDLYFRLAAVEVLLPSLRKRPEDIPPLVSHFLAGRGDPPPTISPAALDALVAYRWPGNVRELRNEIDRAVALSRGATVRPEHLSAAVREAPSRPAARATVGLSEATAEFQRRMIAEALKAAGGNQARAARVLGLHPSALHHRMTRLGMHGKTSRRRR